MINPMCEDPNQTACIGCGAILPIRDGATHDYMTSSPACYALFGEVLAHEYSTPDLSPTHRLTVDTYAVQHPGEGISRRQIQSVGLHLARLGLQLAGGLSPVQTNDVMLGLGKHKQTLIHLPPPKAFSMTLADIARVAGTAGHAARVTEWAAATWKDWSEHHDYIKDWTKTWRWS
jgi:hypothetical protein